MCVYIGPILYYSYKEVGLKFANIKCCIIKFIIIIAINYLFLRIEFD